MMNIDITEVTQVLDRAKNSRIKEGQPGPAELKLLRLGQKLEDQHLEAIEQLEYSDILKQKVLILAFLDRHHPHTDNTRFAAYLSDFIRDVPKSFLHEFVSYVLDDENARMLVHTWKETIEKYPSSSIVLNNAATFCRPIDLSFSMICWEKSIDLAPRECVPRYNLAQCYEELVIEKIHPDREETARAAIVQYENALSLSTKRFPNSCAIAKSLVSFMGILRKLDLYSCVLEGARVLVEHKKRQSEPMLFQYSHKAISIVGCCQICNGSIDEAVQSLEMMKEIDGFYPLEIDVSLANELLKNGKS